MGSVKRVAVQSVTLGEDQIHLIAKALADTRRFSLLRQIGNCGQPMQCTEIKDAQPVSAATLSHHMKELELAGLVHVVRDGKFASYVLRRDVLQAYSDELAKI
jgi:ArsR family transcriptional regulator